MVVSEASRANSSSAMSAANLVADADRADVDRADLDGSDVPSAIVSIAAADGSMDVSHVSTTAAASVVWSAGQPSNLSCSAPVFAPFVASVLGEGSQQPDITGRPGGDLVPQ